jgi:hypothetical protein
MAAPTALFRSDLRLKLLAVSAGFSAFAFEDWDGFRVLDMSLLCLIRMVVNRHQMLSIYLRQINCTQKCMHAAHHTPTVCGRKDEAKGCLPKTGGLYKTCCQQYSMAS